MYQSAFPLLGWVPMELAGVLISTSTEGFGEMRRFYVETLGLRPRSDRAGFVNFDFGKTRLTIATHDQIIGQSPEPARILVNMTTPDIEAAVARCDPVTVVRAPEAEKWGGIVATVRDPDGNFVQFLQME